MSPSNHPVVAPKEKPDTIMLPALQSKGVKVTEKKHCDVFLEGWCRFGRKCRYKHDSKFKEQFKNAHQLANARSQQQASYSHEVIRLKAASRPDIKPAEADKRHFAPTAPITPEISAEVLKAHITDLVNSPSSKPAQKNVNKPNRASAKKNIPTHPSPLSKPADGVMGYLAPPASVQMPASTQRSAANHVPALTQASTPSPRPTPDSDIRQPRPKVSTDSMPRPGNKQVAAPKKNHTSLPRGPKSMRNPKGVDGNTKSTSATANDCRDYKTAKGCPRKTCRWVHRDDSSKDLPIIIQHPQEVEKLIDIDEEPPTTVLQPKSNNVQTKTTKPNKPKKKKRAKKVVDMEMIEYKPEKKEIQWKDNPQLADRSYALNALWVIFGNDNPSTKQIETWCYEMGSQGNFKHFSKYALQNWFEVLQLNDTQRAMLIVLPWVPEKMNPSCRGYVMRLKTEFEREQARPKYNTFYKFAELPNEICVKIWLFTHRFGRTVKVRFNVWFDPQDHERKPLFKRLTPPNPLWETCEQSRQSAMLDRRCCYRYSDYFSYDFDTLFIADNAQRLHQFRDWIHDSDRKTLRRLQFHYYDVRDAKDLEVWAQDVAIFRYLTTLDIIISDAKEEHKHYLKAKELLPYVERLIKRAYKDNRHTPPRVNVVALNPQQAEEVGITYSFW